MARPYLTDGTAENTRVVSGAVSIALKDSLERYLTRRKNFHGNHKGGFEEVIRLGLQAALKQEKGREQKAKEFRRRNWNPHNFVERFD